jgi:hypothetical protein
MRPMRRRWSPPSEDQLVRWLSTRAAALLGLAVVWASLLTFFAACWAVHPDPARLRGVVLLFTGFGVCLSAVFLRRVKRRLVDERRRAGLCVACGYDLRASPGRCPECGTAAAAATAGGAPPARGRFPEKS